MIVLSYRRADSAGFTRALRERLVQQLGARRVFLDVETIEAGVDYRERLRAAIARCDAFLVVIGPDWLAGDASGDNRLAAAEDPVRLEIATALASGKRVIPVLVDGARMPLRAALPAEIEAFADRNALVLTHERFDEDFDRLLAAIGGGGAATRRYAALAGVLVLVAGGAAVAWLVPRDSAPFDLLVRVAGADSAAAVQGFVSMDSGRATRRARMNAQGEAMFLTCRGHLRIRRSPSRPSPPDMTRFTRAPRSRPTASFSFRSRAASGRRRCAGA